MLVLTSTAAQYSCLHVHLRMWKSVFSIAKVEKLRARKRKWSVKKQRKNSAHYHFCSLWSLVEYTFFCKATVAQALADHVWEHVKLHESERAQAETRREWDRWRQCDGLQTALKLAWLRHILLWCVRQSANGSIVETAGVNGSDQTWWHLTARFG